MQGGWMARFSQGSRLRNGHRLPTLQAEDKTPNPDGQEARNQDSVLHYHRLPRNIHPATESILAVRYNFDRGCSPSMEVVQRTSAHHLCYHSRRRFSPAAVVWTLLYAFH